MSALREADGGVIRRLVALFGGALITVGVRLENLAEPPPDLDDTTPCACRGRYVLTEAQLASLVRRAIKGVPIETLALEANVMYRTGCRAVDR